MRPIRPPLATVGKELEASELLELIRRNLGKEPDEIPEGWFTANEWSVKWNVALRTARDILLNATKKGIMKSRRFRIDGGGNSTRMVNHFKQA